MNAVTRQPYPGELALVEPKYEAFVQHYVASGGSRGTAAKQAGITLATARNLLNDVEATNRIRFLNAQQFQHVGVSAEKVKKELADIAFQTAGYFAFKEAFTAAKPCMLEPINKIEIRIPEDCMGKVMGDLSSRRGKIQGMEVEGSFQVIKAHVPAKELYRYSSTLRSLTGGRGVHVEDFSHYEEMPRDAEAKMVEEYKKHRQDGNGHHE